LTEETVETLYLLGEQDRIVGVSGYAVRPRQVRREKPRVSAFTQRDIAGILATIQTLGALVGAAEKAESLVQDYRKRLSEARASTRGQPRPKVYFEEWDDPLISGIGWVSELIEAAGGDDVFAALRSGKSARERIVAPAKAIAAAPDLILASWCGKKVVPDRIRQRPGWDAIPAVRSGRIVEIKSTLILQPGPAALTDGLDAMKAAIAAA
jgi:iron complex transport system substrate-binding protein